MANKCTAGWARAGLAAAAAACLAGCGLFRPASAPPGMERQIAAGERVSAATRQQAPPRAAARPSPAHARRKIPGRQVTAIGDSVMLASAVALHTVLPGIYIDAQPSRQMPAGLDIVRSLAESGRLRPVVVMGLGTNYLVTTGELRELMHLAGPHRHVVLINTYVPDQWSKDVNATMTAFVRRHPSVELADWYDTIRNRTGLLWPDDVHPQLPGTTVYARMVYRAVQATRRVSRPAPAELPPLAGRGTAPPLRQHQDG